MRDEPNPTGVVTPDVDDALAERIGALVDARPDLDDTAALAFAQALAVPCPRPPFGCSQPAGEPCVRPRDKERLTNLVAHERRIRDAGAQLGHTDPRELAAPDELAVASADYRARQHYDRTGDDLDGYHQGRPWSPDGAHLERKGTR